MLVVVNFEDQEAVIDVTVPAHAFDYMDMKEKNVIATDLLTKEKLAIRLKRDGSVRMAVPEDVKNKPVEFHWLIFYFYLCYFF